MVTAARNRAGARLKSREMKIEEGERGKDTRLRRKRRWIPRGVRAAAFLALLVYPAVGSQAVSADAAAAPEEVLVSLLAVGDTGWPYSLPWLRAGQRSVARGMAAEDRRRPVDALVLLGDLFYPHGLLSSELVPRVRDHIAHPFCHFVALTGPRSGEVSDACDEPPEDRHVVPIYAIPGNHDHQTPGSPELERSAIPHFISNWQMPDVVAANVELGAGLSLVLVNTPALSAGGDFAAVRAALRRAPGPWRIVAAHLPVAPGDATADSEWHSNEPPLEYFSLPDAPVHVYLAGHRHNLQLIEGSAPGPLLHVIAGSGSNVRPVRIRYENRRFASERTGFARVDLIGHSDDQRLVVSLFSMPRYPIVFWAKPELLSRWSVQRDGTLRREQGAAH